MVTMVGCKKCKSLIPLGYGDTCSKCKKGGDIDYWKTKGMEIAVANHFDPRVNLIVPNISWGLLIHECDILVLTKSGFATEIEIKVSKADLKKDKDKKHGHISEMIKKLYFAVPEKFDVDLVKRCVPDRAGIISVRSDGRCIVKKKCIINRVAKKFSDEDRFQVARLGAMRIWGLKRKLIEGDA